MRSASHRRYPPQLAISPRPAHRRLRSDSQAGDRLRAPARRGRRIPPDTPQSLGFRMPAEWEPHAATWIAWPHNREDWPGRFAPIPWGYGEIARKLRSEEGRVGEEWRSSGAADH